MNSAITSSLSDVSSYQPSSPRNWVYYAAGQVPATAGWFAYNQDNGFVPPDRYTPSNISCHKGTTPSSTSIRVTASSTIKLKWNTWPDSHKGPVIDYLAKVSGAFSSATAAGLSFTKIDAGGLVSDTSVSGTWASDQLIANNLAWSTTIPSTLASGNYVLRHEIIALHSAGSTDRAQDYPQCINLVVTGSGSTALHIGTAGTKLYTETDPGILINIYQTLSSYTILGPTLWACKRKREEEKFQI